MGVKFQPGDRVKVVYMDEEFFGKTVNSLIGEVGTVHSVSDVNNQKTHVNNENHTQFVNLILDDTKEELEFGNHELEIEGAVLSGDEMDIGKWE